MGLGQSDALATMALGKPIQNRHLESEVLSSFTQRDQIQQESTLNFDRDMIFIPLILEDHFFCACINFMSKTVDYLDNKPLYARSRKAKMARNAANIMGKMLLEMQIAKGSKVESFPLKNVKFKWQSTAKNVDCGVFMMMHMAFYTGKVFDSELGDERKRMLYRAEICAILVLSDLNQVRKEVQGRISKFRNEREQLKEKLLQKRRLEEKKEKKEEEKKEEEKKEEEKTKKPQEKQKGEEPKQQRVKSVAYKHSPRTIGEDEEIIFKFHKDDVMGCSLGDGEINGDIFLVSEFMRANQKLLSSTTNLRRHVLDYAFMDDIDFHKSEILAAFGDNRRLTRADILSLRPRSHTNWMVFECWSLLLNYVENSKRGTRAARPTILYLGLGHMEDSEQSDIKNELFEIWDNFINASKANYRLDAELIFIPCLAGYHYFCVCINFLNKEISVIDSQSYAKWESSFTYNIAMAAMLLYTYLCNIVDYSIS
ncbi:uncharacterized protein LOC141607130 [Silene latifolia]|uniref:uncharacterized protein LOC141607130 n=1 Tax=Silene latifolia TaxID=37657 RepID=UPI003D788C49